VVVKRKFFVGVFGFWRMKGVCWGSWEGKKGVFCRDNGEMRELANVEIRKWTIYLYMYILK